MVKLKLGLTSKEFEEEELERIRENDEEVARREKLYELKVQELNKRKKRDKLLVITSLIVVVLSLIVFGTYNTFFKAMPTEDDMKAVIATNVRQFPVSGLDGFIRNNFNTWYKEQSSIKSDTIERVTPQLNTFSIDNVVQTSSFLARVYFSMDITVKEKDVKENDVVTTGKTTTQRYNFFIPIEYYSKTDDSGRVLALGYRPVSNMAMNFLERIDTEKVTESDSLKFNLEEKQSESIINSAKIKVDKTLSDLYAGKDTSQDFLTNYKFNALDVKYENIVSFEFYKQANELGYNAKVIYNVTTKEGVSYKITSYLALRQNGSTWVIYGML